MMVKCYNCEKQFDKLKSEYWHNGSEYERKREEFIKSKGYRLIRFSGKTIRDNFKEVVNQLTNLRRPMTITGD